MADIDIERKSSHGLLWAVLGLAALGLLLFWLLRDSDPAQVTMVEPATEPAPAAPVTTEPTPSAVPASVQQFQQQCAQPATAPTMPAYEYTANCMSLLNSAIEGSVSSDQLTAASTSLQAAQTATQQLSGSAQDPNNQARYAHDAFAATASTFHTLLGSSTADAAALQQLDSAVEQVSASEPLSEQTADINRFFSQAGSLLGRLSTPAA